MGDAPKSIITSDSLDGLFSVEMKGYVAHVFCEAGACRLCYNGAWFGFRFPFPFPSISSFTNYMEHHLGILPSTDCFTIFTEAAAFR
ncbi:MAG: hypothetical protein IJ692_07730 [Alloprevotella sp.]|nr:hypothetical protein [Alloprevotella sp.]MBR1653256.1 hypothetical protein [Alloprevotella sp.]